MNVLRQSAAIAWLDVRLLIRDRVPIVIVVVMPIVGITFIKPTFELALRQQGYLDTNGSEQAVPGMLVMFAFLLVSNIAYAIFRDHGWGTWDRLRTAGVGRASLLLGKAIAPLGLALTQQVVLFVVGAVVFDLDISQAAPQLAVIGVVFAVAVVSFGLAVACACRTIQQVSAISSVCAILFAGVGGAFGAVQDLPAWARTIAPLTPSYWALRGYRDALLLDRPFADVGRPVAALAVFSLVALAAALLLSNGNRRKSSWA